MKKDLPMYLEKFGLDAIIITGMSSHNPSMNYFTGSHMFTKAYIVVTRNQDPILFYRTMERDTAEKTGMKRIAIDELPDGDFVCADGSTVKNGEAVTLRRILETVGLNGGTVAFSGRIEFGAFLDVVDAFRAAFPEFTVVGGKGDEAIFAARYTKDADELRAIKAMGEVVTGIVGEVRDYLLSCRIKDGMVVTPAGEPVLIGDVKQMINRKLSEAGAENPEGTIFSVGRDAGVPHNSGDDNAQLEAGKTIVYDFFPCRSSGYFFDFTRTWYIGKAPEKIRNAYEQVKTVHDAIVAFGKAGVPARDLQIKTCDLFQEMGHLTVREDAKCTNGYVHSVSHGLGLNVHEPPFTRLKDENPPRLEPGVVYTIEPGLYYPDGEIPFGIRLEDTFYVDEAGNTRYFVEYPYQLELDIPLFGSKEAGAHA